MSKTKDGSITPRTIRNKIDFRITEEQSIGISEFDGLFVEKYESRNQKRKEILDRRDINIEKLDALSKYCSANKLKGVSSKFDKKAKDTSKITEAIEAIRPEQVVMPLEFLNIFQYR